MSVSSQELKAILIAISLDLTKEECSVKVDRQELHEIWDKVSVEVQDITAAGAIVEIPWDPFD